MENIIDQETKPPCISCDKYHILLSEVVVILEKIKQRTNGDSNLIDVDIWNLAEEALNKVHY